MRVEAKIFLLGIFLKQFYIVRSGSLQLGDLCIVISFGLLLYKKKMKIEKIDMKIALFMYGIFLINTIYALKEINFAFIKTNLFYIFSFLLILVFRQLIVNDINMQGLIKILKINLFTQLIIFIIDTGRWYAPTRYMGTFNDPNQMAFYIYMCLLIICILSDLNKKQVSILWYIVSYILILATSSTGIFLGVVVFNVLWVIFKVKPRLKIEKKKLIKINMIFLISIIILPGNIDKIYKAFQDTNMYKRVEEKLNKIDNEENEMGLLEERGIIKVINNPQYIFLGGGEAAFERFDRNDAHEIHSTFIGIFFYYGIVPFILFISWIKNQIKNVPIYILAIYISIFAESLALANQRQPFFWMVIVLGSLYKKERKCEKDITVCRSNESGGCRNITHEYI